MKPIILASTSLRRAELLRQIGLKFKTDPGDFEEDMTLKMPPEKLAVFLSEGKALAVAKKYKNAIVIAADTFAVLDGEIMGKPHTEARAAAMLRKLSGRRHLVLTGLTVVDTGTGKIISRTIKTKVYFKRLNAKEIKNYVKKGDILNKAASYSIQNLGSVLIKKIDGDYFSTVGLPLYGLSQVLKEFGVRIL